MSQQKRDDQCKPTYKSSISRYGSALKARAKSYFVVAGAMLACGYLRGNMYRCEMQRSTLKGAAVIGTEVGAVATGALLLLMIPKMIMTWTTALVFEFLFDRLKRKREEVVQDGRKMAREFSLNTLKQVVTEGNFIAFGAATLYLIVALFSKRSV